MKNKFIIIFVLLISFDLGQTKNDEYSLWKEAEIYYQQKNMIKLLKFIQIFLIVIQLVLNI